MSDDGHGEWAASARDAYTEILIPRPFLEEYATRDDAEGVPAELHGQLLAACGAKGTSKAVKAAWPVHLLLPLADFADQCVLDFDPRAGHEVLPSLYLACVHTLSVHARAMAARELG
ncbi:hypothetical protein [Streptomyces griseoaurantiacus]|uniref:hypothetical protein n=1 Tax=Streptomyces griseoaurantiacus TaxID=68213 RepID=UPI0036A73509